MTIKKGDFIKINYTGRIKDDNEVFDTTYEKVAAEAGLKSPSGKYEPLTIIVGEAHVIPGLDKALEGMEVGKEQHFSFADTEAFGKKSAKDMQLVPAKLFKSENIRPFPGLQVNVDNRMGVVRSASGGRIMVDFNHPLASKDLEYDVKVESIITEDKEKVEVFAKFLHLPIDSVAAKDGKAIITLKQGLPEQFVEPLKQDFTRVTGVKDITFVNPAPKKEADTKKEEAKPAEKTE